MGKRGRKSSDSLTSIPSGVAVLKRPSPPDNLTQEQVEVWKNMVSGLPVDWVPPSTHGLLETYCRHVVSSRQIQQLISETERKEELDIDQYNKLLRMAEREVRVISSLMTKMRLTQQSIYSHKKAKPQNTPKRPWEEEKE